MDLGTYVKKVREEKKWSLSEVAKKSNIAQSYLSQLERNQKPISLKVLAKLAKAYEKPFPNFLMGVSNYLLAQTKKTNVEVSKKTNVDAAKNTKIDMSKKTNNESSHG